MALEGTTTETKAAAALTELMFPSTVRCISVAAQHDLAEILAAGPLHVDELARRSGTNAGGLVRMLRLLTEDGIFIEVDPGVFANTPMSECLRPGVPGSLRSMARMTGEPWLWSCWGGMGVSIETGEAAFDDAFRTSLWAWLGRNPDSARLFNDALREFSDAFGPQLARAYPEFGQARSVCDLGGGLGTYLAAILAAYPAIERGILVDLPQVIEQAKQAPGLAALERAGRYQFAPGDFFEAVPAGVDIYATKQIMHSWPDDQLAAVLRHCRETSPRARIVAAELVHYPGVPRFVKNFDLMMLITMRGAVRTAEQYGSVFRRAGYRITRIVPTETAFSLIEGTAA